MFIRGTGRGLESIIRHYAITWKSCRPYSDESFGLEIRSTRAIRQKRFSKASEKESGAFLALSVHIDETRETEKIIPESPFPC